jgi:hypothetical protein
MSPPASF